MKMKNILICILSIILFTGVCTALAVAEELDMPNEIRQQAASDWGINNIVDYVCPWGGTTAFVEVWTGSKYDLQCYQYRNGMWEYGWHRSEVFPQDSGAMDLVDVSGTSYSGISLGTAFAITPHESSGYETVWEKSGSLWNLRALNNLNSSGQITESFQVSSSGVRYRNYMTGANSFVSGVVQDNIRYFIFSIFPKSLSALQNKLSSPPSIPAGNLTAQNIRFTGGRRYDVYSGPGTFYLRGGNGKAMVSTNDWIQVFGEENGWILIQYNISEGHMRFGYIDASALPRGTSVSYLNFDPLDAVTLRSTTLTDDPLNSGTVLLTVGQGVEVEWLCAMGDWAYIEILDEVDMARGFVPVTDLQIEGQHGQVQSFTVVAGR